ncbi:hypothetical protein CJ255_03770 [Candidatus Viridilinea mediisalina]|uniref:Uncharacterized protein n=1 Tax=Candidatus Viridilinea mediisalina TaxID=2024553 RepID=A0A2A6RN69_9CHLR|nr:hypothetical protein CJ255_03770 [Candidatus Viridilinea mediisalina]
MAILLAMLLISSGERRANGGLVTVHIALLRFQAARPHKASNNRHKLGKHAHVGQRAISDGSGLQCLLRRIIAQEVGACPLLHLAIGSGQVAVGVSCPAPMGWRGCCR